MAAIKSLERSGDKWTRRAQVAAPDYQQGVQNPRTPWAEATEGASENYRAGVTQAANAGRFAAGVRAVGEAKWKQNALRKGPGRFAEGVTLALGEWQKGFRPVQEAFAALTPPARGVTGSPANLQRVGAFNQAARRAVGKEAGTT